MLSSTLKIVVFTLVCTTFLGGCGQKGPLYLPIDTYNAPHERV
jgi:predicted small lipoprotein YifL